MTEDFKALLKQALPQKIIQVFEDYRLLTPDTNADIKTFGAYHSACKNALAHIWMMMKLLALVQENEQKDDTIDWLEKAKQALQQEENENDTF